MKPSFMMTSLKWMPCPGAMKTSNYPGKFTLTKSNKKGYFNWVNGPQAIKPHLFKSKESLWQVARDKNGKLSFEPAHN